MTSGLRPRFVLVRFSNVPVATHGAARAPDDGSDHKRRLPESPVIGWSGPVGQDAARAQNHTCTILRLHASRRPASVPDDPRKRTDEVCAPTGRLHSAAVKTTHVRTCAVANASSTQHRTKRQLCSTCSRTATCGAQCKRAVHLPRWLGAKFLWAWWTTTMLWWPSNWPRLPSSTIWTRWTCACTRNRTQFHSSCVR